MTDKQHRARKRFGQNFLTNQHIINKLVTLIAPKPKDQMVEIGPGQGALTAPLLNHLDHLTAIEIDRDLQALLEAKFHDQSLSIIKEDALKVDIGQLVEGDALRIVGNLPYNISTPLIFHLLCDRERIKDMHFMLQLEVVERLAAAPGSKTYGKLSVICQYFCQVEQCFVVPPNSFSPPPKVMSAIVKLSPRPFPTQAEDDDLFIKLVKLSFAQRRKTLKNNLKNWLTAQQIALITDDLTKRPETLSLENYVKLSNTIRKIINKNG